VIPRVFKMQKITVNIIFDNITSCVENNKLSAKTILSTTLIVVIELDKLRMVMNVNILGINQRVSQVHQHNHILFFTLTVMSESEKYLLGIQYR